MKVLAIGAHPDDIEIFMYGIMSIFKSEGHQIYLTITTDGSLGGDNKNNDLHKIRELETQKGLSDLAKPTFLRLPDGNLGKSLNHINLIEQNVKEINPNLIITHHPKDYHSDHRVLSNYIKKIAGHYTPVIHCDTLMGLNFDPSYYIDITDCFEKKIQSIMAHRSQKPERFANLAKIMNSYRSAQCNAPLGNYAEAYSFNNSFPFADIRNILPKSLPLRPFHISKENGLL